MSSCTSKRFCMQIQLGTGIYLQCSLLDHDCLATNLSFWSMTLLIIFLIYISCYISFYIVILILYHVQVYWSRSFSRCEEMDRNAVLLRQGFRGTQRLFFCKITVRRSKYCLEISWSSRNASEVAFIRFYHQDIVIHLQKGCPENFGIKTKQASTRRF